MGDEKNAIHRYTDLPGLLYMLKRRELTLLDPSSWDDRNDSHFLAIYKKSRGLSCLAALCLSEADETYHHWRVFASGSSGVRITFRKEQLLRLVKRHPDITCGSVRYEKLADIRHSAPPAVADLPFLKRYPYGQENEFRLLFESKRVKQSPINIDLPLSLIRRVTLSPWMNARVSDATKEVIRLIPGCTRLSLQRSTLIGNEEWKGFGDSALKKTPRP